jgi:hypothetical protein
MSLFEGKERGILLAFTLHSKFGTDGQWVKEAVVTPISLVHSAVMDAFKLMSPPDAENRVNPLTRGSQTVSTIERKALYADRMVRLMRWMTLSRSMMCALQFDTNIALLGPEDPWHIQNRTDGITTCERIVLYRDVRKQAQNESLLPVPIYADYSIEPVRLCPNTPEGEVIDQQAGRHNHPRP